MKKKLIKTSCGILGAAVLLAVQSSFATMSYNGTYSGTIQLYNSVGDEITAHSSGLGNFETFCLNKVALANSGQVYNYVSSDNVIPVPAGASNPDPVTLGTAWLYSEFRSGGLASAVGGFTYNDASSADQLQQAIWYLEGSAGGLNNAFVTAANAALQGLGYGNNSVMNAANGAFGVFALHLTANGSDAQPVLGMVPEPSTVVAGMLLLLPFGISTFRIIRKSKLA